MESQDSIDHLITIASEKLIAFDQRLNHLKLIRFPSDNPKLLIEVLSRLGKAFQQRVSDYRDEFLRMRLSNSRKRIKGDIVFSVLLIKTLGARLRYIEGASVERTPWSMVHAMEQLAEGLLEDVSLIIRPQWHYNYGGVDVITEWKSEVNAAFEGSLDEVLSAEEWKGIYDELPERFYVLSFPGLERDNALLHVNLGHEIGHIVIEKFLSDDEPRWSERFRKRVDEILVDDYEDQTKRDLAIGERVKRIQLIRRRALEEIISDYFSIYLFGPAALFALHEVAIFAESLDKVSPRLQWYPPWRLRLRFALKELCWHQWSIWLDEIAPEFRWRGDKINGGVDVAKALNEKVTILENIAAETTDQFEIKKDELTEIAYESLDETLSAAKDFLKAKLGPHLFVGSQTICRTILQLVERLHYGIPPNELGGTKRSKIRIADIRAIFNAGWFYRIAYLPSMYGLDTRTEYFQQLEILNRLVLKGIEMSDLQREYEKHKLSVNVSA